MSRKKDIKDNAVFRNGTSQRQRLADTSDLNVVKIDERSEEDLLDFAAAYADQIQFYNSSNVQDGDWKVFFEEPEDSWKDYFRQQPLSNQPHLALFYTFVQLFKHAQESLNTLTRKHLDFYYTDVLKLRKKGYTPNQVHIILGLAKNETSYLLREGTLLDAGKDDTGAEIYYKTNKDIVITTAQIASLKTLYLDKTGEEENLHAAPVADSADGQGAPLTGDQPQWSTFGSPGMPAATIGFAVASPVLFMAEGTRTITITLTLVRTAYVLNRETLEYLKDTLPEKVLEKLQSLKENSVYTKEDLENIIKAEFPDIDKTDLPPVPPLPADADFNDTFQIRLSGAKGWITPSDSTVSSVINNGTSSTLAFTITLNPTDAAVTAYNKTALGGSFSTQWPLAAFLFNTNTAASGSKLNYNNLKYLQVQHININVDVKGIQNLLVQNDQSLLNPEKPFYPFGSLPAIGSSCYIGSAEVFQKKLHSLKMNINWYNLPVTDASNNKSCLGDYYYPGYIEQDTSNPTDPNPLSNCGFQATLKLLYNKSWNSLNNAGVNAPDDKALFSLFNKENALVGQTFRVVFSDKLPVDEGGNIIQKIRAVHSEIPDYSRNTNLQQLSLYNNTTQNGFVRLTLTAPVASRDGNGEVVMPITAFGHKDYPNVYATQSIAMSAAAVNPEGDSSQYPLPNSPYTPSVQSLSLEYSSSEQISWDFTDGQEEQMESSYNNRVEQFFHITPFGCTEVHPYIDAGLGFLLPFYYDEGNLYIGLNNVVPGQNLNMLFQVAEGSEDPDLNVGWKDIRWSYLVNDRWKPLSMLNVLSDTTNRFQSPGIIRFDIPEDITDNNNLMSPEMYWLKASIHKNAGGVCRMISIRTQAVTATFTDNDNDINYLNDPLPANTITKLAQQNTAVKTVSQPYASFGGKPAENSREFYARVSERLRHKERAVSIFDYERLVLEHFPDIYKVNCLGLTDDGVTITPGTVNIVVIPSLINQNAVDPFQPKAGSDILNRIKNYLKPLCSGFVKLSVENPQYEQIQLSFKVAFKEGYNNGYYGQLLNTAIKEFLSPWAYKKGRDIMFGGKIYKSAIQAFVEGLLYVDFTTDFTMYQIINDQPPDNPVDVAVASTPKSILVSANNHNIGILESGTYECQGMDNLGIGYMIVEVSLEVS